MTSSIQMKTQWDCQLISQQKLHKPEEVAWYALNAEKEEPKTKNALPNEALIQIWWRNQKIYRQAKTENSAPPDWLCNKY